MTFKTEQEKFWATEFGDNYIDRNDDLQIIACNINLFSKILQNTIGIKSIIEFGSNIGNNLKAIKALIPNSKLSAIEINQKAVKILKKQSNITVYAQSILEFEPDSLWDLVFIKGVLIHIEPNELQDVYKKLYNSSKKYILIAEYYNPYPITIPYRGHLNKLFKRDFAGEMLDKYPDLKLVDYGFSYRRDKNFPQDDITWFLLEK
jgi:pseudaminic acid biosynthesis-associated methylase